MCVHVCVCVCVALEIETRIASRETQIEGGHRERERG